MDIATRILSRVLLTEIDDRYVRGFEYNEEDMERVVKFAGEPSFENAEKYAGDNLSLKYIFYKNLYSFVLYAELGYLDKENEFIKKIYEEAMKRTERFNELEQVERDAILASRIVMRNIETLEIVLGKELVGELVFGAISIAGMNLDMSVMVSDNTEGMFL